MSLRREQGGRSATSSEGEDPLIVVDDVSVTYHGQSEPAVRSVSLEVSSGAALGIVGESGSGKTTLARTLVGALAPTGGAVLIDGRPWSDVRRTDQQRRRVQMIFQDPYGSLNPWQCALDIVADALRQWEPLSRRRANAAAVDLLGEVGLSRDAMERRAAHLSGGQCQRVGIARALACNPDVLVADEPTSSLDVSVQAQILNILLSLRESRSLALVLVSHDLMVVDYVTTDAIIMYGGQIVEQGKTSQLIRSPKHPYTRVLIDSIPGREGDSKLVTNDVSAASGCGFAPRCAQMRPACVERAPQLEERGEDWPVRCFFPLEAPALKAVSGTATNDRS